MYLSQTGYTKNYKNPMNISEQSARVGHETVPGLNSLNLIPSHRPGLVATFKPSPNSHRAKPSKEFANGNRSRAHNLYSNAAA